MQEDSIFHEALQKESPETRAAFLDQACAGNAELRAIVERLLRAHERADDVLGRKAKGLPATVAPSVSERVELQIGPYKLLEKIGEGGFGVVFMAEQQRPVRRRVALKVVKPGMDTHQVIARFEQERQALAVMDHLNIAKVLDAGTTDSGRPFFVMELIRGVPITQYCDDHQLTPRQRLQLFVPVCQAVQHAHQKGIIHRDIKPSNVLVTLHDGQPLVKVIDFGVAKAMGQQLTEKTLFTNFAQMIGTPLYMSPEQAELTSQDIDTRTDIYSLGVLVYELLTGTTPIEKQRFRQATFDEIRRIIREEEPPRPSLRLSSLGDTLPSISALRHMEPRSLTRLVRGDLDWIVLKALEKDRNRRYETANGLAMDVQRYLADEPVLACPPSVGYRLRKFARRNRWSMATVALVAAAILLGSAVSVWQAIRATRAELQATQNAATAETQRGIAVENDATAKANEIEAYKQTRLAKENEIEATKQSKLAKANEETAKTNERLASRRNYASQMNLAARTWEEGDTPRVLELLETQRPRIGEEDLRAFEWYALWQLCHERLRYHLQGDPSFTHTVAYSPDSRTLALGCADGTVKLLDASNGQEIVTLQSGSKSRRGIVAFSPAGKLLAQDAGPNAAGVILWNFETGEKVQVLASGGQVNALAISPDGQTVATATNTEIALWESATGSSKDRWQTSGGDALAFSPDGKLLAASAARQIRCWRVDSGQLRLTQEAVGYGSALAFSGDGKRLAVAGNGYQILDAVTLANVEPLGLRNTPSGIDVGRPWLDDRPAGNSRTIGFVPGRDAIAIGLEALSFRIVDFKTQTSTVFAHQSPVRSLAVSPDGKSIAAMGADATLKVWNIDEKMYTDVIDPAGHVFGIALTPDGQTLAVGGQGSVKLFDTSTGVLTRELTGFRTKAADGTELNIWHLVFLRDNITLIAASGHPDSPGELRLFDISTGQERSPAFNGPVTIPAISPDEQVLAVLAVGGSQRELALFNPGTAQRLARVKSPELSRLNFSPDGQFLISAARNLRQLTLRDPATGAERLTLEPVMESRPRCMTCTRDSKLLAVGSELGPIYLWEIPSGRLRTILRGGNGSVADIGFLPDDKTLVTTDSLGQFRFWDVATGQERVTLPFGQALTLSADGKVIAAGDRSRKIRLLRASTALEALARKSEFNLYDPANPQAQNDTGERLWAAGNFQEAEQNFRQARERLLLLLNQVPLEVPQEVAYRRELVRSGLNLALLNAKQMSSLVADEAWRNALAAYRQLPADEQRALASNRRLRGEKLFREGNKAAAAIVFDQAQALRPDDPAICQRRALLLIESGQPGQALAFWRQGFELYVRQIEAEPTEVKRRADFRGFALSLRQSLLKIGRPKEAAEPIKHAARLYQRLIAARPQDVALRTEYLQTIFGWAQNLQNDRLLAEAEALIVEGLAAEQAVGATPDDPEYGRQWAELMYGLGWIRSDAKRYDEAADAFRTQIKLMEELAARGDSPPTVRLVHLQGWHGLGSALASAGQADEATAAHEKALELAKKLADDVPTNEKYLVRPLFSHAALIYLHRAAGRTEPVRTHERAIIDFIKLHPQVKETRGYLSRTYRGAWAYFTPAAKELLAAARSPQEKQRFVEVVKEVLAAGDQLLAELPGELQIREEQAKRCRELATLLRSAGAADEAESAYQRSLSLYRELAAPSPEKILVSVARAAKSLADTLSDAKSEEAVQAYAQWVGLLEQIAAKDPKERANLAHGYRYLASTQANQSPDDAEKSYRKALEIFERLLVEEPTDANNRYYAADTQYLVGDSLAKQRRWNDTRPWYQKAITTSSTLPADYDYLSDDAKKLKRVNFYYFRLAHTLQSFDEYAEAQKVCERGIAFDKRLCKAQPGNAAFQEALTQRQIQLSQVHRRANQEGKALLAANRALEVNPQSPGACTEVAWLVANLANGRSRNVAKALDLAQKSVSLGPHQAGWQWTTREHWQWTTLGAAQYRSGKWQLAIESLGKADKLQKVGDLDWGFHAFFLAMAHWQLGNGAEARSWYANAVEWMQNSDNDKDNPELIRFRAEAEALLTKPR